MIDIGVTGLVKSFDLEKKILDGLTLQIDTGERVGILGRNGAGKTTFFKILTGELDYDSGEVFVAPGKRLGLISQIPVYPPEYTVEDVLRTAFSRMERLKGEMDALAEKMAAGDSSAATLKRYGDLSARFEGLGGWDTDTAVSKVANGLTIDDSMRSRLFSELSGGEKTRVNLGRLILEDTDILLLDEPTNHLDAASREELENTLLHYDGTMLIVSHDRYFINKLATRVLELTPNGVQSYTGNYDDYMAHRAVTQQRTAAVKEKPKTNSYKEQKERASRLRKLRTAVTRLEAEIEETEAEIKELQAQLSAGADYQALMDLTAKLDAATARRDDLYARWENASEELAAGEEEV